MSQSSTRLPILCMLLLLCLWAISRSSASLTTFYFRTQDIWLLLGMAVLWLPAARRIPCFSHRTGIYAGVPVVTFALFLVCLAGHWLILSGYDASRDEQLAVFDTAIFASGRLVAPINALWRDHSAALNTTFLYPAQARSAWVSSYLPINATTRALVGVFTGWPEATGPLWTATGALALWGCIRRLWPHDREAVWVGMLLYGLSGQILLTGMTAYAMPGHLTLNLIWLWLFLQRRIACDGLALLVAFLAVGLHQPLMHPLFAAPVLLLVVLRREWGRAALYLTGYAVIGAFWLHWPSAMWQAVQTIPDTQAPVSIDYLSRLTDTVSENGWSAWPLMMFNLARFAAWNHPLLLPLFCAGLTARRVLSKPYSLATGLAAGLMLTTSVMLAILPYQGHGFGYRYLHGLIGNAIILALYGWQSTRTNETSSSSWNAMLRLTSWATLLILLPAQLWFAHSFYETYARPARAIEAIDADYVAVHAGGAPFAADLVINRPDLDNRPVRIIAEVMDPVLAERLCRSRPSVGVLPDSYLAAINNLLGGPPSEDRAWQIRTTALLAGAGCRIAALPPIPNR